LYNGWLCTTWILWLRSCDAALALPSTTTTESIVKPDVSRHLCLSVTGSFLQIETYFVI
jgi:hypothetical protein